MIIGEPFADLVSVFQPFKSRKITSSQALEILEAEHQRGHVHTAWFKSAMLDRFYAICNCCSCCCEAMQSLDRFKMKTIAPSGYVAQIGAGCNACGECMKSCQFEAVREDEGSFLIGRDECYGCGVCVDKCPSDCIDLIRDPSKGEPLNIVELQSALSTDDRRQKIT